MMAQDSRRSIRGEYESLGVQKFYATRGGSYRNPHEERVRQVIRAAVERVALDLSSVLDLACGSGEVTLPLLELGAARIDGVDPYTGEAYRQRTGRAAEPLSFEDIASGALGERSYTLIVCSFALHLVSPSRLPVLLYELARLVNQTGSLLIITPHKRPEIQEQWGWRLDEELLIDRVRGRIYSSLISS
jgi:SAM-dependent methyltransferase